MDPKTLKQTLRKLCDILDGDVDPVWMRTVATRLAIRGFYTLRWRFNIQ